MITHKVGVLAIQGGYSKHYDMLKQLNVEAILVKTVKELESVDRLIIPGGESTTLLNLIHKHHLWTALKSFVKQKPVFGTCAGSILLSRGGKYLNAIALEVKRNAYGSQINSFVRKIDFNNQKNIEAVFIRAPIIVEIDMDVDILAKCDGLPVLARQKNILVSTFHPELTSNEAVHRYFLSM